MLREERDRALKVGVKQSHKKSPFNEGQNVPDSIVSALSSSPGDRTSFYLAVNAFGIQTREVLRTSGLRFQARIHNDIPMFRSLHANT